MRVGVIGKGFVGTAVYEGLGQIDNERQCSCVYQQI